MRLNRGTIILFVVSLAVIIGVLMINNNQATAPAATTPSPSPETGGPIFAGITPNTLVRFEVRDNTTGQRTVFTRTSEDVWGLDEAGQGAAFPADEASGVLVETTAEPGDNTIVSPQDTFTVETTTGQALDQSVLITDIDSFLALNANDSFESSDLESFGLANPDHSIIATAEDGTVYLLHVGGQNPSGNRYYSVLEQLSGADVSDDEVSLTEEPLAVATIILDAGDDQAQVSDNIQGAELDEATEGDDAAVPVVEDVTEAAELSQMIDATNIAAGETAATDEAGAVESTGEAGEAVATEIVEEGESSGRTEQIISGTELDEATAEPGEETPGDVEVTAEATVPAAPQPTATLAPLAEPMVTMAGTQTIYTLPKTTLDALIALIMTPPLVTPTLAPTSQVPLPEVTVETSPLVEVTLPAEADAEVTAAPEETATPSE